MKTVIFSLSVLMLGFFTSCNSQSSNKQQEPATNHDSMKDMSMDTMKNMNMDTMKDMKNMKHDSMSSMMDMDKPSFKNVDASVSKYFTNITLDYLDVKNSLANDDAANAANAAAKLLGTIKHFDKSFFPAAQKKEYDKQGDAIKEQSQLIAGNNDIEIQRAAFNELSNQLYGLVKTFGSEQMLYYDNCPMAFNKKGAIWLSETKDIHNPYLGIRMTTCGKIEGIIE